MLYLALSCLQGRLGSQALAELLSLSPDGIQLTPGNVIDLQFPSLLKNVPTRTHNGFSWKAMRKRVWGNGALNGYWDSVHAPTIEECGDFFNYAAQVPNQCWEIMYPSEKHRYHLSAWSEIDRAMYRNMNLAIDLSHLEILEDCNGTFPDILQDLYNYHNITEIHISQSHIFKDAHKPITKDTRHLSWAKERLASGTPVILECYMHRLTQDERQRQVDLLRK